MLIQINVNESLRFQQKLSVIQEKIKALESSALTQTDKNRLKHLKECEEAYLRLIERKGVNLDPYLYHIYTAFWGKSSADDQGLSDIRAKEYKNSENCPALSELVDLVKEKFEEYLQQDMFYLNHSLTDSKNVPQSITARQARLVLASAGLLEQTEEAIVQMDKTAQIEWEYATSFERNAPLILAMQEKFGLTDEQVDEMFKKGSKL